MIPLTVTLVTERLDTLKLVLLKRFPEAKEEAGRWLRCDGGCGVEADLANPETYWGWYCTGSPKVGWTDYCQKCSETRLVWT